MKEKLKKSYLYHLKSSFVQDPDKATPLARYQALALSIRDLMIDKWISTGSNWKKKKPRTVYYLSLEYLMGRTMGNALINLEIFEVARDAMAELGFEIKELKEEEADAGLGNGGLGRLAACYLDSMATLNLPAWGYGIRYNFGIFKQVISKEGCQVEEPDNWLRNGNIWEIQRPEHAQTVCFYGYTKPTRTSKHKYSKEWLGTQDVIAMPYDTPIPGYKTDNVNTLRLWSANSAYGFDLDRFNRGDYLNANLDALLTENITKVLYPNDNNYEGKELRMKQQYFLVSATIQDILQSFIANGGDITKFDKKVVLQLNDTHPAMAIPELMRILLDEYGLTWDRSWKICTKTFNYTNHTLMPEALEKWPVKMMKKLLPRIMEIVFEINSRFMHQIATHFNEDMGRMRRMSLIEEGKEKNVRMAYLAIIGSSHVNGVAALHTELLKQGLFKDFYELSPSKFINVTNGITPRRWLRKANPDLADLISSKIGDNWIKDLDKLSGIEQFSADSEFQRQFLKVKNKNKEALADYILKENGVAVNIESIFDVQVKRLHEYKRQLMNILHAVALYLDIKDHPNADFVPRTIIFGAKAAPGYFMAKLIIRLINAVGTVINNDRGIGDKLKIVFLANYRVSLAEKIIPAADLSEQISMAGTEASGTGNMKFGLNGALTIGTMDGANVEMHDAVGAENIFIFGLGVDDVKAIQKKGYRPHDYIEQSSRLKRVLELIRSGFFSPAQPDVFKPVLESFIYDTYMIAADFNAYYDCQQKVSETYRDLPLWSHKAILNIARMWGFSSDRSIRDYAEKIWKIEPCPNTF